MRSELVFKAVVHEPNRYLLVRLISKATRKLHRPNTRLQDTANEVFERFDAPASTAKASKSEGKLAQDQRAA